MKTILVDAVNTLVVDGEINTDLQTLLDTYENRKIVVTNANEDEKKTFGLVDLPYELFSLAHNPNKTDPIYFEKLFQTYELTAADVIYFEHNPDAVASAQSVGIPSFFYDSSKRDIA
jgi:HAD superfamily hydrolase (TIGR01509 family)